jgi:hypothetical protein
MARSLPKRSAARILQVGRQLQHQHLNLINAMSRAHAHTHAETKPQIEHAHITTIPTTKPTHLRAITKDATYLSAQDASNM